MDYMITMLPGFFIGMIFGIIISPFISRFMRRGLPKAVVSDSNDQSENQNKARVREVERLARSIYDLSSQVDSQVGQHSQKVSQITNSLSESETEPAGTGQILMAGKQLLKANERLQLDLEAAKQEIRRQREQLNSSIQESQTDALTGLANRRALDLELDRVVAQSRRDHTVSSVLMIDIDHFKKINDQFGHMVGDQLLKGLGRCLMQTLRETDFVGRFGGEEFVVLLKKTPLADAIKAADRIRNVIATNSYRAGEIEIRVTISIGLKVIDPGESEIEVLQKADQALYAAKNGGRNCCFYHDGQECHRFVSEQPDVPLELLPEAETISLDMSAVSVLPEISAKSSRKSAQSGNVEKSVP